MKNNLVFRRLYSIFRYGIRYAEYGIRNMRIDILNLQNKVRVDKKGIKGCAERMLEAMGERKAELSLLFVDDSCIRELNWHYRKVKSRTDVLAFSMREGEGLARDSLILGDVVISTETARREARKRKILTQKEMYLYLVHGILHLLGYDDRNRIDRKRMKTKELELLEAM